MQEKLVKRLFAGFFKNIGTITLETLPDFGFGQAGFLIGPERCQRVPRRELIKRYILWKWLLPAVTDTVSDISNGNLRTWDNITVARNDITGC